MKRGKKKKKHKERTKKEGRNEKIVKLSTGLKRFKQE